MKPTLALAVIARNEERFLGACLASVTGVVDQIVVCDTGSTDETVSIATAAGANVTRFAWVDDFAAARNHALSQVTTDWVLVLDADEQLAPNAAASLRRAITTGGFHCGLLPLHNATHLGARPVDVLSGRARRGDPVLLPRLLRRDEDLAWQGAIHESVAAWLSKGRTAREVPAAIVHYGDVPELRADRDKDARNLGLLERACAAHPTDAVRRTYLARELLRAGQDARALHEITQAWSDLLGALTAGERPSAVSTVSVFAFLLLQNNRLEEALQVLEDAEPWCGGHPNLALFRASAVDLLETPSPALLAQAIRGLEANLQQASRAWSTEQSPGACSWAAATLLGQLRLREGRSADAQRAFARALSTRRDHLPAQLGVLEAQAGAAQAAQALRTVQELLSENSGDVWFIAALAAQRCGDPKTATALLLRSRGRPWHSPARARRAVSLLRSLQGA